MTLLCARSFAKDEATPTGNKSVLFSLNLRKGACSLLAYLPSDAFWALPGMISSKAVTHIGVRSANRIVAVPTLSRSISRRAASAPSPRSGNLIRHTG